MAIIDADILENSCQTEGLSRVISNWHRYKAKTLNKK
jgi:hypothetical protein